MKTSKFLGYCDECDMMLCESDLAADKVICPSCQKRLNKNKLNQELKANMGAPLDEDEIESLHEDVIVAAPKKDDLPKEDEKDVIEEEPLVSDED